MPKGKTSSRKDIDDLGGPKRLDVAELSDDWTNGPNPKERVLRGLFHKLFVNRDYSTDTEELNPFGRKFLSTFGRLTANKLPVLNISMPDLDQLLEWMNATPDPEAALGLPGLGISGDTISKNSPLVLWDDTYTSVLPVVEQVTQTGKERAKSFLDSSNKSDSLAPIWDTFKNMLDGDDFLWDALNTDDEGVARPSKKLDTVIQEYARPKAISVIERLITAKDTPQKRKDLSKLVSGYKRAAAAQGNGKTFSPSILRIGRGSYEY